MGLIDIVVIVLVVVAIASRFTKFKLPRDTRDKAARRGDLDALRGRPLLRDDVPKVVDITQQAEATPVKPRKPSQKEMMDAAKGLTGMAKIKALEPGFDEAVFLDGAKSAYTYFYTTWNARDQVGLDNLCAPKLYDRLMTELHDDAIWQPVQVDAITSAEVVNARVHGRTVVMEVDFEAVQREGNASARTMRSRWVLARPLGSEDPNWELQDIKTGMDA